MSRFFKRKFDRMNFKQKYFFKKSKSFVSFILLLIVIGGCNLTLADTTIVGNYTLTFEGVSYDIGESTSTWCYTLLWNGTPPQLSHLTIQLGPCAQVLSASPPGFIVGLDGSTGIFGIKWNTTIPADTPTQFCFTLDGLYIIEPVQFSAKAGSNNNIANIVGPSLSCQECRTQISCPADLVLDCSSSIDPIFTGEPTVQGNCPPFNITYQDEQVGGVCPPLKIIQRTWTVTDAEGLTVSCQQNMLAQDTIAPILGCGPSKTIFHPDPLVFDAPEVSDNCDSSPTLNIVSTVSSPADCPYVSIHTRTWEAVDDCGHVSAQCSQSVRYQKQAPVLTLRQS